MCHLPSVGKKPSTSKEYKRDGRSESMTTASLLAFFFFGTGMGSSQPASYHSEENTMHASIEKEIIELHQFFQDWFNAKLPRTEAAFSRFDSVMAPGFQIITPEGRMVEKDDLNNRLEKAHGAFAETGIRIWVENIRVRPLAEGLWIATYEEWQEEKDKVKTRLSTAIFALREQTPNNIWWRHVHETWLPDKK
jgi:hypothetical protein